jgi:riboflavin synthase
MFTGIIEELGTVSEVASLFEGARIVVNAATVTTDLREGDSIAVNGVCLTALDVKPESFAADVSPETLHRSTIGALSAGSRVNLERPVTPSTRLGGHIVQGHVDGRGSFLGVVEDGEFHTVSIDYPRELAGFLVFKGSIAVEGISLTIASLTDDSFDVAIVPKTWEVTNLSTLREGDSVNIEVDVIAKYVERMLALRGLSLESLPAS